MVDRSMTWVAVAALLVITVYAIFTQDVWAAIIGILLWFAWAAALTLTDKKIHDILEKTNNWATISQDTSNILFEEYCDNPTPENLTGSSNFQMGAMMVGVALQKVLQTIGIEFYQTFGRITAYEERGNTSGAKGNTSGATDEEVLTIVTAEDPTVLHIESLNAVEPRDGSPTIETLDAKVRSSREKGDFDADKQQMPTLTELKALSRGEPPWNPVRWDELDPWVKGTFADPTSTFADPSGTFAEYEPPKASQVSIKILGRDLGYFQSVGYTNLGTEDRILLDTCPGQVEVRLSTNYLEILLMDRYGTVIRRTGARRKIL